MDKRYFIKLTQAVYRTTDRFPEGEPLKARIRDKANEILTDLVIQDIQGREATLKAIELMESYFEVARIQNWVEPLNFVILEEEYGKITEWMGKQEILRQLDNPHIDEQGKETLANSGADMQKTDKVEPENKKLSILVVDKKEGERQAPFDVTQGKQNKELIDRHKKIIEFLKTKGRAQVWEIKQSLPDISKRTIRRDFEYLVGLNLVERIGEKNNTFYKSR